MNLKPLHIILSCLTLFFSFAGCNSEVVYEQNKALPDQGWHQDSLLEFTAEINDTVSLHEIYLNVRNTTDYPYRNLFIFMDIEFPDGTLLRDTLEAILAERTGEWTGSGFGAIKSNRFLFRDEVWFPHKGEYSFTMQQAMRREELEGIADIGIRIEKK